MKHTFSALIFVFIGAMTFISCSGTGSNGENADSSSSTTEGQTHQAEPSPEESALTAYASFLAGDRTLLAEPQSETWWIPDFQEQNMAYEYTCLDLDGDGARELLVQMEDDPNGYNGVFHFEDGKIICWNSDAVEMTCWDVPLADGTMARQYYTGANRVYTIFRYRSDGSTEDVQNLFAREELVPEDSKEPCPYYEVDGKEVGQAEFGEQLDALLTSRMLERSAWKKVD